ncbi:DUF3379 family protein [Thiolapillus sp.]
MNCEKFQNLLMEDPSRKERDFLDHRDHCPPCAREWQQAQEFEAILRAAVSVSPEKELEASTPIQRPTGWWRQTWVRAASVLLLIGVSVAGLNLAQQLFSAENLPQLVVRHIQKEPEMLGRQQPLGEMELMKVLTPMEFSLVAIPGEVTAAAPCWIRKGRGMHLVMQGVHGPVTVLLMPGEHVSRTQNVVAVSLSGSLVPTAWGSMAVVSHAGDDVAPLLHTLQRDVRWKGMPAALSF